MTTKKWTAEEIQFNIERDNAWLYRGLMAIYTRQTEDEKASALTKHDNGVGFNGPDSNRMSRYAKNYLKYGMLYAEERKDCRKRMIKYCGQLAKIANKLV